MSVAMLFPGQGSQSVGMLAALAEQYGSVAETFSSASAVLGYDLWDVVQNGPEATLNETAKTQPAMLTAGVAVWRVWQQRGGQTPALMAGHSLGEYTALVCAGALGFEDAVALVADRGRYMQDAVPKGQGAMAALLGMADDDVAEVCERAAEGQTVAPANFNSPGQCVIAGHAEAVQRATELAKAAGAKRAVVLPVSVPSHCELMAPAADRLRGRLAEITIAQTHIPVLHNVDAAPRERSDDIADALVAQLHQPVRWVDLVNQVAAANIDLCIEAGPGKVLSALNRRIDRSLVCRPVFDPDTLQSALGACED